MQTSPNILASQAGTFNFCRTMDLHDLRTSKASCNNVIFQPPVFDCPGHTSKKNSYDLDVSKVILKTGFHITTPGDRLYLMCVVSTFCHFFCFCSLRNCCWSGRPYQLLRVKTNCCTKGELSVQTPAFPDSLHLEKPIHSSCLDSDTSPTVLTGSARGELTPVAWPETSPGTNQTVTLLNVLVRFHCLE